MHLTRFSIEHILTTSWDRRIAADLVAEIETCSGEKLTTIEEMRRFLAIKGYRELLERLKAAHDGRHGPEALKAIAEAMRLYALVRPALAAAAFRVPTSDSPEWLVVHREVQGLLLGALAESGLCGKGAVRAVQMLRSLVRGYVLHEMMNSFLDVDSYAESYECALEVVLSGLAVLRDIK
jgi:hypothetical protein